MSPAAAVTELPPIAEPAVMIVITTSVFVPLENVSLEPAVKLISPAAVVVTTNVRLKTWTVWDTPSFVSVFNVLIVSFLNFLRRRFFSWSRSWFLFLTIGTEVCEVWTTGLIVKFVLEPISVTLVDKSALPAPAPGIVIKSPTFKSLVNVVLKPVTWVFAAGVPLPDWLTVTVPPSVRLELNTKFAVKSWPVFGEFINTDFTSSKFLDVIAETVTAALLEFITNWLALLEVVCEDEISSSPTLKLPDTVINWIKLLTALWIKPVAPEVLPVIFEPCATDEEPLKFALIWIVVNIRISKRYKLNSASLSVAFDNVAFDELPEECSNARARATPICAFAAVL